MNDDVDEAGAGVLAQVETTVFETLETCKGGHGDSDELGRRPSLVRRAGGARKQREDGSDCKQRAELHDPSWLPPRSTSDDSCSPARPRFQAGVE